MNLTRGCFKVISLSRLVALQDCLMGIVPVVPHMAVAEVSRIGNLYRRDWLLLVTDGRAKTLMDRTVQLSS